MNVLAMTETPDTIPGAFKRTSHGWEPDGWDPAENEALAVLSGTEPVDVARVTRHLIAWEDRGAPTDVLAQATTITTDPDERRDLAQKTTDPATLTHLALSPNKLVRQRVASNPKTPHWVINGFVTDRDVRTRRGAATHDALAPENFEYLAHDNSWEVRARIAGRTDLPDNIIRHLAEDTDDSGRILDRLAGNKITPDDILVALASSDRPNILRRLVRRADIPPAALEIIAQGTSQVAATAKSKLAAKTSPTPGKKPLPGVEFAILETLVERTERALTLSHWETADQVRIVFSAQSVPAIKTAMDYSDCCSAYSDAVKTGTITPLDRRFRHFASDIGAELLHDQAALRLAKRGLISAEKTANDSIILGFEDVDQYQRARDLIGA